MQTSTEVAESQRRCVDEILGVLVDRDTEALEEIRKLFDRGARKWSIRGGVVDPQDELLTILLQSVAALYKQVDELREELEEFKPRRGRPPKSS